MRDGRYGSVAAILAQFRQMAALEQLADVTETRFWSLRSRCLLSPIADVQ